MTNCQQEAKGNKQSVRAKLCMWRGVGNKWKIVDLECKRPCALTPLLTAMSTTVNMKTWLQALRAAQVSTRSPRLDTRERWQFVLQE